MPVHDWTRVDDGIFHDFHLGWIGELRKVLNAGLLPSPYYALAEQVAGSIGPDVLTLHAPTRSQNGLPPPQAGAVALAVAPPQVQFTMQAVEEYYVHKHRTLVIRHTSNHRIIALVEVLSAGNKSSKRNFQSFVDKALSALDQGIHLLLIDVHPPGPRDPNGIHGILWDALTGKPFELPPDQPLTLAAYAASEATTCFVEPTAVGAPLKKMPLFLTPDEYVNIDLESTYQAAYQGLPLYYRNILEA